MVKKWWEKIEGKNGREKIVEKKWWEKDSGKKMVGKKGGKIW